MGCTGENDNRVVTGKDQKGTITNTYDALNRLSTTTDVFGLTVTYNYDAADRVTEVDDSKGGVLTHLYDNANRLTTREFGGANQTQARVNLNYSDQNELAGVTRYSNVARTTLAAPTSHNYDHGN